MKILYFSQHFSTPIGSAGTRSYEFARRCVMQGHNVTIVCGSYAGGNTGLTNTFINGKREGKVDGIHVIEYSLIYSNKTGFLRRTLLFFLFAFKSIGLALSLEYDILFATSTPLTAGIPGIIARWFRRKIFVFEVRDLWPELPKAMGVIKSPLLIGLMGILEWLTYHSAHRLIGLSPGICSGINARGIPLDRILEISNGCDIDLFQSDIEPWLPSGISETDVLFIYSGTIGTANGLHAVLNGIAELNKRATDGYKILLVGEGREKKKLQNRVNEEKLENRILFMDPVPKVKLVGLYKSCDVGMQILDNIPSFYYGTSPNKFFDYISSGLPVLCNYPGWVSDMVVENKCGFFTKPGDEKYFANTIELIISQKEILKDFGYNSLQLAKKRFDRNDLSRYWIDWVIFGIKKDYTQN